MKCLSIQLQPHRDSSHSPEEVIEQARRIGRFPEVDQDESLDDAINLNFFTEFPGRLWHDLQSGLLDDPALGPWIKNVAIIICEGDQAGDYLLLHHFDSSESLDRLEE